MKKRSVLISVLSIAFSVMFFVVSSRAKAETQDGAKKDLVSVFHLEAVSLSEPEGTSGEKKDRDVDPLRTLFVPLKEELHGSISFSTFSCKHYFIVSALVSFRKSRNDETCSITLFSLAIRHFSRNNFSSSSTKIGVSGSIKNS